MRSCLVLFFAVTWLAGAFAVGRTDVVQGERGQAIDRYVSRLVPFGVAGALHVSKDGVVLVERGYGIAERVLGDSVEADSPFLIGSLSKQFTAAAILALQADGHLSVADSVGRFYPDAPAATRALTIHQLLSHTSGMPYFTVRPFFETRPREEVMREMLELPLEFAPSSKWAYSNTGYTLLAGIVERASGQRFEDYLSTRLFQRAGLARTRCLDPALRDTTDLVRMHSYSGDQDEGTMLPLRHMSKSVGAGSVVSTAADLGRWAKALSDDRVLPARERALLFTPHAPISDALSYAYGWNVGRTSRGTTMFTHAGDLGGWNADMRIDRDAGLVLVFLSNQRLDGRGSRETLMNPVTLLATGAPVPELPALRAVREGELFELSGRYTFPGGGTLLTRSSGTALEVSAGDAAGLALLVGDAGRPPDSLQLVARASEIAEGLARRRWEPFMAALHPGLPAHEVVAELDGAMTSAERRLGSFTRIEDAGSVVTGPNTALSFVRVHRREGSTLLRLGWVDGKVLAFDLDAPNVLPTRFLPAEDGSWVNIDPFTKRVTRLSVDRDGRGKVMALGLGESAESRAKRSG